MTQSSSGVGGEHPRDATVALERDVFLRSLVGELAESLEDVVGLDEASGFVSIVGQRIGEWIDAEYRQALGTDHFEAEQVAQVLVDLKRRIQGDFRVIEQDDDKIVFANRTCPFGDKVLGRTSMCMMTSNVFGVISAQHLGYARVELDETIAKGNLGCRVVVHLKRPDESAEPPGREYFKT